MNRQEQRISPAGFARLKETLATSEAQGYGPEECTLHALWSVGLGPHGRGYIEPKEIVFIVDYSLDGPVFPFMAWPQ